MKKYSRVCAYIDLDAIAYNMEQMKKRIGEDGKLIAVYSFSGISVNKLIPRFLSI